MPLALPLFISFNWNNLLDILLVAVLIYQLYKLAKGTVAIRIFVGIVAIYVLWKLVVALQMEMLGEILGQFIQAGVIVLIIVFQQEIRRFLLLIGNSDLFRGKGATGIVGKWLGSSSKAATEPKAIVQAVKAMAATKTGALIVLARHSDPLAYCSSSEHLDAQVTANFLESIFFKNSPLHDGAIIIADNRVKAVRAVLPVTESADFPTELGMRHRSAVGITEQTDAMTVIVSEQTGAISLALEGQLQRNVNIERLEERISRHLGPTENQVP